MRRPVHKTLALLFLTALICSAGCQEAQTPSDKQSRLIAAQTIELEKQVAARDKKIRNLEAQYAARIGLEKNKLAACQKQTADCKEELRESMAKKLDEMLVPTLNEVAKLRSENEKLRAKIAELEGKASEKKE